MKIRNSSIYKIVSPSMNITRSGDPQSHIAEQTMTGLAPGSYEVLIFDWESNDSVPSTPSYVGHVIVTDTATVSTASATLTTKGRRIYQIVTIVTILWYCPDMFSVFVHCKYEFCYWYWS